MNLISFWASLFANLQANSGLAGGIMSGELPIPRVPGLPMPTLPSLPIPEVTLFLGLTLAAFLIDFISSFVIGIFLIGYMPKYTQTVLDTIKNKPGPSFGLGIVAVFLTPFVVAVLFALGVTSPLSLILGALYLIYLYVSKIYVFLLIGQLILGKEAGGAALALGLFIYEIAFAIPIVSSIVMGLTAVFGLGAIYWAKVDYYNQLRSKEII